MRHALTQHVAIGVLVIQDVLELQQRLVEVACIAGETEELGRAPAFLPEVVKPKASSWQPARKSKIFTAASKYSAHR